MEPPVESVSDVVRQQSIEPFLLRDSIVMHLAPGLAVAVGYAVFAAVLTAIGLPNMMALMLAVLLVEAPLLYWLMRRASTRKLGHVDWTWILPWKQRTPAWVYIVVGLPLILFSVAVIAGVTPAIGDVIFERLFSELPDWFALRQDPDMFAGLSRTTLWLMWAGSLVAFVLVGGVMQEVYFRGFLLPRLERLGHWGPVLNAGLFAVYHFVTPWSWPGFFIMVVPWAYVVRWRRSLQLGIFIHVGMLLVQTLMMTLLLLGLVPPPA